MTAAASLAKPVPPTSHPPVANGAVPAASPNGKAKRYVSWREFVRRYLSREDGFKYEWNNGEIEKTPRAMNFNQLFVSKNLNRFLDELKKSRPELGDFYSETDIFFFENIHKRPDITYFTDEQVEIGKNGGQVIPSFVIEVISPSDNINRVVRKVNEYFRAGVCMVWHIFPDDREVHVYETPKRINICRDEDVCSAEPVISGFMLEAREIFK